MTAKKVGWMMVKNGGWWWVGLVVGDCVLGLVGEVVVEEFVAGFVASLDLEE